MTIALLFSLETCIVEMQSVGAYFACTKRLFNLSAEVIINVRNAHLCVKCAIFLLKNKETPFFLSLGQGVYIFEERPKSVQEVIGDVYCPGKYCLNTEKCKSIGGYVTTPRSIYGCDNCGAWLFVHKVPFKLQEHVKTTKTDKTRFFFAKKKMLLDKQLFVNVPFQSTKYGKIEWFVDIKVRETIGDVFCPTSTNGKGVYISTNETTSFYDCKKCIACCHVLNIPFKDQKLTIMLFGGDGTHCFAKKTSRDYEKPSPFLKKFLGQSQPSTSEPVPKKDKSSPNMD